MSENFFGLLQKIKCLKHFAMVFYWMHTKDESQLICLFECLPSLQSLELTIKIFDQASYFKCLEECISRSSLEKFHLEVCSFYYSCAVLADSTLLCFFLLFRFLFLFFFGCMYSDTSSGSASSEFSIKVLVIFSKASAFMKSEFFLLNTLFFFIVAEACDRVTTLSPIAC